jgi:hypothetical protein
MEISSTSGGRSVGIVRSRTKGHGVCCLRKEMVAAVQPLERQSNPGFPYAGVTLVHTNYLTLI